MNPEIQKRAMDVAQVLAAQLGVAVSQVFELLTRQMFAEGAVGFVFDLVLMLVAAYGAVWLSKVVKENYAENSELGIAATAGTIICVLLAGFCFASLPEDTLKMANPQYYAFERACKLLIPKKE